MSTIKDVALKAGVTVTTVSRVLNNRGYISEKTRLKVHEAMTELNYQPNEIARSLFKKRSGLMGLIIPNVGHPFFGELTEHIELYAYQAGFKLILCNSYRDSAKEKDYLEMLRRNQVDGIIMGSHSLDISHFLAQKLPMVTLDRFFSEDIPSVTSDNYRGGYMATELLIQRGCRNLAHISGPLNLTTQANRRYDGFRDAAEKHGAPYTVIETTLNRFEDEEYSDKARMLLSQYPDVDGVFASSDVIAANLIRVALNMGRRVPEDLKVIGYDDIRFAALTIPSITTIRQPIGRMAETAVQTLNRMIGGETVEPITILPVELVERDSTGQKESLEVKKSPAQ